MRQGIYKAVVAIALILGASSAFAEEPDAARLETVKAVYESAIEASGEVQLGLFRDTRDRLDGIIDDYPASDAAVAILLRREILGLDLGVIDTALITALGDRAPAFAIPAGSPVFQYDPDETTNVPDFQLGSVESPRSSTVELTDVPDLQPGSFESPDGYVWVQIASRENLEEARAVASAFDSGDPGSINLFRSENGWYAITGPLVPIANVDSVIEAKGYPADSLSTRGSRYIERIALPGETGFDMALQSAGNGAPDALQTPSSDRAWTPASERAEEELGLDRKAYFGTRAARRRGPGGPRSSARGGTRGIQCRTHSPESRSGRGARTTAR